MFPFLVLFVIWLVAWFVIRMREQRKLQRELDELIAIEKENSS
jgi:preprotein translocase subunit YajC